MEINLEVSELDLDTIKLTCPFRAPSKPGSYYGYGGSHEHTDEKPEGYPCSGYDRGPSLIDLIKYAAETAARLDMQLNPPPPKPEPKKRVTRKKVS